MYSRNCPWSSPSRRRSSWPCRSKDQWVSHMLDIRGLSASIGDKPILKGIDLTVPEGEVHAIMGPNGSGKSTLGYVLSGREDYEVTAGSATFNGINLLDMEPEARAAAG